MEEHHLNPPDSIIVLKLFAQRAKEELGKPFATEIDHLRARSNYIAARILERLWETGMTPEDSWDNIEEFANLCDPMGENRYPKAVNTLIKPFKDIVNDVLKEAAEIEVKPREMTKGPDYIVKATRRDAIVGTAASAAAGFAAGVTTQYGLSEVLRADGVEVKDDPAITKKWGMVGLAAGVSIYSKLIRPKLETGITYLEFYDIANVIDRGVQRMKTIDAEMSRG